LPRLDLIRLFRHAFVAVLVLIAAIGGHAQSDPGTGTVTGQVFCSDTQKPARFATVNLSPAIGTENPGNNSGRRSSDVTKADGTFVLKSVPPGVYDLQVTLPGYIQPLRQLNLEVYSDPEAQKRWLAMLTHVTVQAGQTSSAIVTAYRGADLTGTVLYDDGSPAAGVYVMSFLAETPPGTSTTKASGATAIRPLGVISSTDDRGHFYLSGLAQGTYTVDAFPRGGSIFPVYLGNTIDRSQAELVTVQPGEVRPDLELQIDITNLHHVRGVLVTSDNHPIPGAGVSLILPKGGTDMLRAVTSADGSFSFNDVPDGKFTVSSGSISDPETRVTYRGASAQITVSGTDVADVVLTPSS
jgi:hypothetical protein